MGSMMNDGCELRPGTRAYRDRLRQIESTERRLRAQDRRDGGRRLRAYQDAEAKAWRENRANHRRNH